jgi:hypothetical protein
MSKSPHPPRRMIPVRIHRHPLPHRRERDDPFGYSTDLHRASLNGGAVFACLHVAFPEHDWTFSPSSATTGRMGTASMRCGSRSTRRKMRCGSATPAPSASWRFMSTNACSSSPCSGYFYHVLDALMFYYNYKTSYWIYWVLLAVVFGSMVTMCWPRGRMRRV